MYRDVNNSELAEKAKMSEVSPKATASVSPIVVGSKVKLGLHFKGDHD